EGPLLDSTVQSQHLRTRSCPAANHALDASDFGQMVTGEAGPRLSCWSIRGEGDIWLNTHVTLSVLVIADGLVDSLLEARLVTRSILDLPYGIHLNSRILGYNARRDGLR